MMILTKRRSSVGLFLCLAAVVLAGCAAKRSEVRPGRSGPATENRVVLDGRLVEWPADVAVLADAHHLYFRLGLESEATLQAGQDSLTLLLDADGVAATGWRPTSPPEARALGVDLAVQFAPRNGTGGVAVFGVDSTGARTPLTHATLDLSFAPTYAAPMFEVRLSRHPASEAGPSLRAALAASGAGRAMFLLEDASGKLVGWSDPETFSKPVAAPVPLLADDKIPVKQKGTIRVVSYNVLKGSPMKRSDRFSRVFLALEPDIILVQEWTGADAADLRAWCTALLTGSTDWYSRTGAGEGVAIISPFPIRPLGPDRLTLDVSEGVDPEVVRWIAGVVETPIGDVAVASVHLKCCGSKGSPEDQKRLAQARVINEVMKGALTAAGTPLRIVAGDFNLVGSRPPLDVLRQGLDADGSDLELAEPFVTGDAAQYTWSDPASPFTPGRLDYTVFGDATAQLVNAFVFDTSRLSDAALARLGLDRADTSASDHLPIVIDIRPR